MPPLALALIADSLGQLVNNWAALLGVVLPACGLTAYCLHRYYAARDSGQSNVKTVLESIAEQTGVLTKSMSARDEAFSELCKQFNEERVRSENRDSQIVRLLGDIATTLQEDARHRADADLRNTREHATLLAKVETLS